MPHGTRVHIIRIRSDGFIAHHLKIDSEYNYIQLFTSGMIAQLVEHSAMKQLAMGSNPKADYELRLLYCLEGLTSLGFVSSATAWGFQFQDCVTTNLSI